MTNIKILSRFKRNGVFFIHKYLHEIDEECEKKYDYLLTKMMQEEGINEIILMEFIYN